MSKLKISISIVVLFLSIGCNKHQNSDAKAEKYFLNKVEKLMEKSNKIETDFTDLVSFDWDKVCFTDGKNITLDFHDLKTGEKHTIELSKNYHIQEDYVEHSPIRSHYKNSKLTFKNCWEKSTLFTINNWSTKVNSSNKKNGYIVIKTKVE